MAKIIPIGEPVNDAERQAIARLRDTLPEGWLILHNFEVRRGQEAFEVDLAILAPHAVYLVDVKGTRGLIDVYGSKWYPQGRSPFTSPLLKLRGHARALKGALIGSQPGRRDLEGVYVDAVVLLTAPDAHLNDRGGRDEGAVTDLAHAAAFFQNTARLPGHFSRSIKPLHNMVLKAIHGVARPRSGPLRFGNWQVTEKLGGTDHFSEYRAHNLFAGADAGTVLLRVYGADPYLPAEEREAQVRRIANAYQALSHMPAHANLVNERDFFAAEGEGQFILVTEDVHGQALRVHIDKPTLALTLDQKFQAAQELLEALVHAHAHGVVHRNINPGTLLWGEDGQLHLTGFDFARVGEDRSRTIAHEIVDDLEPEYMAPEVYGDPATATAAADLFSAGLVLYELFTGERAFGNATEIYDQNAHFPVAPSAQRPELPKTLDDWLQGLCAFQAGERPAAKQALADLQTSQTSPQNAHIFWTPASRASQGTISHLNPQVFPARNLRSKPGQLAA